MTNDICRICGKRHGSAPHAVSESLSFTTLTAANSNFAVQYEPPVRNRLSAREAMAFTKKHYKETLDYLA